MEETVAMKKTIDAFKALDEVLGVAEARP